MTATTYTLDEIEALAGWLREGFSGNQVAHKLTVRRGVNVTRNAIIGIVKRNKVLNAIGFARSPNGRRKDTDHLPPIRRSAPAAVPTVKPLKQRLHPGNIVGKKQGRQFDPGNAKPVRVAPTVFECRSVPLTALKRGECKFAVNDAAVGEVHLFCGLPADSDRSYCDQHAAMAYQPRRAA